MHIWILWREYWNVCTWLTSRRTLHFYVHAMPIQQLVARYEWITLTLGTFNQDSKWYHFIFKSPKYHRIGSTYVFNYFRINMLYYAMFAFVVYQHRWCPIYWESTGHNRLLVRVFLCKETTITVHIQKMNSRKGKCTKTHNN